MLVFAAMCFVLALVFTFGAYDTYIKEGKKKAYLELVKAAAFAIMGIVIFIIS